MVAKKGFGGFSNTPLDTILRNMGITTCVACGVTTCVCVSTTIRGGVLNIVIEGAMDMADGMAEGGTGEPEPPLVSVLGLGSLAGLWQLLPTIRHPAIERRRDLALFNLALDSKLRGCDLVRLQVNDVCVGGRVRDRATVVQRKTGRPVQFDSKAPSVTLVSRSTTRSASPSKWNSKSNPVGGPASCGAAAAPSRRFRCIGEAARLDRNLFDKAWGR